jgi:3,4-dihydroxy 2-butanone 4-phosphate synthase / GTP cyclohydrolase II
MATQQVLDAISAIGRGEVVVVADHHGRENEGDLIVAAQHVTSETLAFIVRHTSGVVCVALPEARLAELSLPLMVTENRESLQTAFTVSVDYRHGTSTGISASDRAATIRALADPTARAGDFTRPGHVFPLRARARGVLERPGHTEAALDLARLAGLRPGAALCELLADDGSMLRRAGLERFAREHGLCFLNIEDLRAYRRRTERLVERVAEARLPTRHGLFEAGVYRSLLDGNEHLALVRGEVSGKENVLTRVHSECLTGDIFGSLRCDCREQLEASLGKVACEGAGVIVYLRGHEGRGIGLSGKLNAYRLQDLGRDTVEANVELGFSIDARSYDVGAQILGDLGIRTLRLMSNNPAKFEQLEGYELRIVERVPLVTEPTPENVRYLHTKQQKLGHRLGLENRVGAS